MENNKTTTDNFARQLGKPHRETVTCSTQCKTKATTKTYRHTTSDKASQLLTSLPVTSCFLGLILSQGVTLHGDLWYINYTALFISVLTLVAIVISYASVPASNDFCEYIFLLIVTPCSSVFNIRFNYRDVYENEESCKKRLSKTQVPKWLKQFMLIIILSSPEAGVNMQIANQTVAVVAIYKSISTTLRLFQEKDSEQSVQKATVASVDYLTLCVCSVLILIHIVNDPVVGLAAFAYFLFTDAVVSDALVAQVQGMNFECMEGLDKYYTIGLRHLAEIVLSAMVLYASSSLSLLMVPLFYTNIYQPFVQFRDMVKIIRAESLCLSNFDLASQDDLDQYDDVCAICLCSMKTARKTPCKHIFHGKCLKDCLRKKPNCPMCNTQVL